MTICPSRGVAYIQSERHQCQTERTGFAASLPQDTAAGLVKFGVVAGVGWAVVPFALIDNLRPAGQMWTVPVAGALTGIVTSFTLAWCLRRFGRIGALGAGIVALPVGAFIFGVTISIVQLLAQAVFGGHYRTLSDSFEPVQSGFQLAVQGTFSIFGPVLIPLAVWTTWQLKIVVDGNSTRGTTVSGTSSE